MTGTMCSVTGTMFSMTGTMFSITGTMFSMTGTMFSMTGTVCSVKYLHAIFYAWLFDMLHMHMSVISCTFSVLLQVSDEFDDESFHSYALFSLPFSS